MLPHSKYIPYWLSLFLIFVNFYGCTKTVTRYRDVPIYENVNVTEKVGDERILEWETIQPVIEGESGNIGVLRFAGVRKIANEVNKAIEIWIDEGDNNYALINSKILWKQIDKIKGLIGKKDMSDMKVLVNYKKYFEKYNIDYLLTGSATRRSGYVNIVIDCYKWSTMKKITSSTARDIDVNAAVISIMKKYKTGRRKVFKGNTKPIYRNKVIRKQTGSRREKYKAEVSDDTANWIWYGIICIGGLVLGGYLYYKYGKSDDEEMSSGNNIIGVEPIDNPFVYRF